MKNKALFVHIAKTGGSSLTHALNPFVLKYGSQRVPPNSEFIKSLKFRFSFVRNPYTRYASVVLNLLNKHPLFYVDPSTFTEFTIYTFLTQHKESFENWDIDWMHLIPMHQMLHYKDGKPEVDFVGRFENLQEDYEKVREMLGVGKALSHENKSDYSGGDYEQFYTPETKKIVADVYSKDFETFGYKK